MEEKIFERLERIECYAIIAAKRVLNLEEVAFLTGLSKSWLYKATCDKKIPHYKPNGKLLYFDRGEIEDWMKQNRIATSNELNNSNTDFALHDSLCKTTRITDCICDSSKRDLHDSQPINLQENHIQTIKLKNLEDQITQLSSKVGMTDELHALMMELDVIKAESNISDNPPEDDEPFDRDAYLESVRKKYFEQKKINEPTTNPVDEYVKKAKEQFPLLFPEYNPNKNG